MITNSKGVIPKSQFTYDPIKDQYNCPNGHALTYRTTNRIGQREYKSDPKVCGQCPFHEECTTRQDKQCVFVRHIWESAKEKVIQNSQSKVGEMLLEWRQRTIERSFADAKVLHNYRRCKFRGLDKTQEQAFMTAIAQNLKMIVRYYA